MPKSFDILLDMMTWTPDWLHLSDAQYKYFNGNYISSFHEK